MTEVHFLVFLVFTANFFVTASFALGKSSLMMNGTFLVELICPNSTYKQIDICLPLVNYLVQPVSLFLIVVLIKCLLSKKST